MIRDDVEYFSMASANAIDIETLRASTAGKSWFASRPRQHQKRLLALKFLMTPLKGLKSNNCLLE